ncbi:hypothetical protein EVAR_29449_1 [Eumeta japonica]|uniref:Uncharacterized protein n=1 Tax=Eumeta variegata TaxID=151549 RepID=A0A4C1VTR2_EUMVA|nr:hypothetical protein EVAR_29449_1 [Eumeta japonica]
MGFDQAGILRLSARKGNVNFAMFAEQCTLQRAFRAPVPVGARPYRRPRRGRRLSAHSPLHLPPPPVQSRSKLPMSRSAAISPSAPLSTLRML